MRSRRFTAAGFEPLVSLEKCADALAKISRSESGTGRRVYSRERIRQIEVAALKKIRQALEERGLTAAEFFNLVSPEPSVTPQDLRGWESGCHLG